LFRARFWVLNRRVLNPVGLSRDLLPVAGCKAAGLQLAAHWISLAAADILLDMPKEIYTVNRISFLDIWVSCADI
jgi:hypothetical protein